MSNKKKNLFDDLYKRAGRSQKDKIVILPELRELIPPLSREESEQLEENIKAEGCRESLLVWQKSEEELVLIDGHNRHRICTKHSLEFSWKIMQFPDLPAAKNWMIDNQLGRRNLKPEQASYLRGLRYNTEKQAGFRGNQHTKTGIGQNDPYQENALSGAGQSAKGQNDLKQNTAKKLALDYGVSEKTIKRDADYAKGLDKIGSENADLKRQILSGEVKVSKTEIQAVGKNEEPDLSRLTEEVAKPAAPKKKLPTGKTELIRACKQLLNKGLKTKEDFRDFQRLTSRLKKHFDLKEK